MGATGDLLRRLSSRSKSPSIPFFEGGSNSAEKDETAAAPWLRFALIGRGLRGSASALVVEKRIPLTPLLRKGKY
jgi:hypothetical protein